jgi:type IV secretion system protein VirB3
MANDSDESYSVDTLFLAVTRPALWFGIPIEAGVLIAMSAGIIITQFGNPLYAAVVAAVGFFISRIIVRRDVNAFRLLMLWGRTKVSCRNRRFWGGSSYSPLPAPRLKNKYFGRGAYCRG